MCNLQATFAIRLLKIKVLSLAMFTLNSTLSGSTISEPTEIGLVLTFFPLAQISHL